MAITHYETLGVTEDATQAEITSAFRTQMRALHADAGGDDELAKRVSAAYNVLSNAARRAAYDRTLDQLQPSRRGPAPQPNPTRASRSSAGPARDRVFTAPQDGPAFSMMDVDPSSWDWYAPAEDVDAGVGRSAASGRSAFCAVLAVLSFLAWAGAGAAAASTLGLPLARIDALAVPAALTVGVGVHLTWTVLMVTRAVMHRWGLVFSLLLALVAAGVIHLEAGTPLPSVGAALCYLASMVTTYLSFGMVLARAGAREGSGIIDFSFITQVGATTIGDRHPDIDRLLTALKVAFEHRKGVRLILLPDRITPRTHGSPVRAQVAVVVGRGVHLIALPAIGGDGMEISGSEIISDRSVHRNVVRDEVQALAACYGRGGQVRGYVIPIRLGVEPPAGTEAHCVTFASLNQVIDAIGHDAGADLDKENGLFRRRALDSMSLLV